MSQLQSESAATSAVLFYVYQIFPSIAPNYRPSVALIATLYIYKITTPCTSITYCNGISTGKT